LVPSSNSFLGAFNTAESQSGTIWVGSKQKEFRLPPAEKPNPFSRMYPDGWEGFKGLIFCFFSFFFDQPLLQRLQVRYLESHDV
jgi:hypothetical protein